MKSNLDLIYKYIDENREEILALYRDIVNLESPVGEPEKVNIAMERLKEEFEKEGFTCKLTDVGVNGNSMITNLSNDSEKEPIIFSGHVDTVFPTGTFEKKPFKIVDGKAYGPGVLDMKGGIMIALYVIKALNSIGYKDRPIKVILSGDEEIGHLNSRGKEVFLEEGKGGICAFNMETGLVNNDLCIGRKGRIVSHISVEGIEAHAGNDFISGRNAIGEMAYKIIDLHALTNLDIGTTVSVGTISGGTVTNAVPKDCMIKVDCRFEKIDELENTKQKIKDVCKKTYIEGTKTTCEIVNVSSAYETTDKVISFYNFVNKISQEFGFGEMGAQRLGGSSDASYITIAGTPVICSFGIRGEWNHTEREYAVVESLFERSKLISTIIMNLDSYKK